MNILIGAITGWFVYNFTIVPLSTANPTHVASDPSLSIDSFPTTDSLTWNSGSLVAIGIGAAIGAFSTYSGNKSRKK